MSWFDHEFLGVRNLGFRLTIDCSVRLYSAITYGDLDRVNVAFYHQNSLDVHAMTKTETSGGRGWGFRFLICSSKLFWSANGPPVLLVFSSRFYLTRYQPYNQAMLAPRAPRLHIYFSKELELVSSWLFLAILSSRKLSASVTAQTFWIQTIGFIQTAWERHRTIKSLTHNK